MQILFLERGKLPLFMRAKDVIMDGRRAIRPCPAALGQISSAGGRATGRSGAKLLSCVGAAEAVIHGSKPFEKA
jgi:hypothetical protein